MNDKFKLFKLLPI